MGRRALKGDALFKNIQDSAVVIIKKALKDPTVTPAEKRRIAMEVFKKGFPKQLDLGDKTIDSLTAVAKKYWTGKDSKPVNNKSTTPVNSIQTKVKPKTKAETKLLPKKKQIRSKETLPESW